VWKNPKSMEPIIREMGILRDVVTSFEEAQKNIEILFASDTPQEKILGQTQKRITQLEISRLFSGKWDQHDAVISIYAGAGGQDAADWTHMLYGMYQAFAEKKGWKTETLDWAQESGEGRTGRTLLKNITFKISGEYAFGYLKKESGVHRLVRVSPFSSQGLRHTSFALVEVMPFIAERTLQIKDDDLSVEFFRSSGPGGQNVNKVETAVRITHVPTGIVVASQAGRSQSQNREQALSLLEAKLIQRMEQERVEEVNKLRTKAKPEWGSQIRSYVLNPYKLVKDHRTEHETTQVEKVLEEGDLDGFIEAELVREEDKNE